MTYTEVTIECAPEDIDSVCDRLTAMGCGGFVIENEADLKDFLENNRRYWDYVDESLQQRYAGLSRVKCYLEDNGDGQKMLTALRAQFDLSTKTVRDSDWENNWKKFYKPLEIGERFLVVPEWEEASAGGRVNLRLDPGLMFGTGSHATTRMCLAALEKYAGAGKKVLDLGCGSGILSIAALLLGAAEAFACDIDDKCVGVAYENAALNGIGKAHYTVRAGDVTTDSRLQKEFGGDYDVIVANIVADVIIALSTQVRRFLKPGGVFLCSGIIDDRAAEVKGKLIDAGWEILEENTSEGWYSYLCS